MGSIGMLKEKILVVDDDREIVRLLRSYLEKAGFTVFTAYDGQTAVQILRHEMPALVLLDLMLPDTDGFDITRHIRSEPRLHKMVVIMLTARVEDTDKIVGLELGADDYVTKPFNPAEVVARVRAQLRAQERVAQEGDSLETAVLQVGTLHLDSGRRELLVGDTPVELTPTEFNILQTLMESPGFVFTRSELITHGLGQEYIGMDRTLDSHIKNLRRKIEPDPKNPTLIQTVYGVGYRLSEDE
jgi:two-component system alkaline phosphatase synthesis response regulator PhoP